MTEQSRPVYGAGDRPALAEDICSEGIGRDWVVEPHERQPPFGEAERELNQKLMGDECELPIVNQVGEGPIDHFRLLRPNWPELPGGQTKRLEGEVSPYDINDEFFQTQGKALDIEWTRWSSTGFTGG